VKNSIILFFLILFTTSHTLESKSAIYDLATTTSDFAAPNKQIKNGKFLGQYWSPPPDSIVKRIKGKSWSEKCPLSLHDLAYIQITHWNFNDKILIGELIYHKDLAFELIEIFQELFEAKFPIKKMVLIDDYDANDVLSMEDNNSSAFCFRVKTGKADYSKHSYGGAIDINPLVNPYIRGNTILPKAAERYVDRNQNKPGLIKEDDVCYQAFIKRGYFWGGHWTSLKDYQHFEKSPTE